MAVRWKSNIKLKEYNDRVHGAIVATCERRGEIMQGEARQGARWVDRTGNARSGLFAKVEDSQGRWIRLYLAHTMDYGQWLELSNGGRYAILWPTIEANLTPLMSDLQAILN